MRQGLQPVRYGDGAPVVFTLRSPRISSIPFDAGRVKQSPPQKTAGAASCDPEEIAPTLRGVLKDAWRSPSLQLRYQIPGIRTPSAASPLVPRVPVVVTPGAVEFLLANPVMLFQ
jgi:hypothetical protein